MAHFNEDMQVDLLFWKTHVVLHMIDVCLRFAVATIIANRTTEVVLEAITRFWFRVFGPPQRITSDHEGALDSDAGRTWATRWGTNLSFRPHRGHAQVVERHNALLRDQLHLIDDQLKLDGVAVSDEHLGRGCPRQERDDQHRWRLTVPGVVWPTGQHVVGLRAGERDSIGGQCSRPCRCQPTRG